MANQISGAETFVDSIDPGDLVTAARLNNMTNGAVLLNGAVINQTAKAVTLEADMVLLGDSAVADTTQVKMTTLANLLPETVRNGSKQYAVGTLSVANYTVSLTPAPTVLTDGMVVRFKASAACPASPTLTLTGVVGANPIVTSAKVALAANDILTGQVVFAEWVAADNQWQMLNTSVTPTMLSSAANASAQQYAVAGGSASAITVELPLSPAAYVAGQVVRFKVTTTSALSGGHTTLNVTRATVGVGAANIVNGLGLDLQPGELVAGQIAEVIYEAAVGVWQLVSTLKKFVSALTTIPGGSTAITPIAHGLGAAPSRLRAVLVNTTAELGYSIGDEVNFESVTNGASATVLFSYGANATQIFLVQGPASPAIYRINSVIGTYTAITVGNWKIKFYAEL